MLEQLGPNGWEPLAFYSLKLDKTQSEWPAFDRELLGAFRAVRHFRPMVEGRPFTLFTDQQALVPSLNRKVEPLTARHTYQLSCIAEFTTDIRYIEGNANVVADALSRPNGYLGPINSIRPASEPLHIFKALIMTNELMDGLTIAAVERGDTAPGASGDDCGMARILQHGQSQWQRAELP